MCPIKSTLSVPLPLHNGPVQQPEPSAAVAAVTVTTSTVTAPASSPHQPTACTPAPLPSTSPAGGVLFPSSLLHQEEPPVTPTASIPNDTSNSYPTSTASSQTQINPVTPQSYSTSDIHHSSSDTHHNTHEYSNNTTLPQVPSTHQFPNSASDFSAHYYSSSAQPNIYNFSSGDSPTHQFSNKNTSSVYPKQQNEDQHFYLKPNISTASGQSHQNTISCVSNQGFTSTSSKDLKQRHSNIPPVDGPRDKQNFSCTKPSASNTTAKTQCQPSSGACVNYNCISTSSNTVSNAVNSGATTCYAPYNRTNGKEHRPCYLNAGGIVANNRTEYYRQRCASGILSKRREAQTQLQTGASNVSQPDLNLRTKNKTDLQHNIQTGAKNYVCNKPELKHHVNDSIITNNGYNKSNFPQHAANVGNQWTDQHLHGAPSDVSNNSRSGYNTYQLNSKFVTPKSYPNSPHHQNAVITNNVKTEKPVHSSSTCWADVKGQQQSSYNCSNIKSDSPYSKSHNLIKDKSGSESNFDHFKNASNSNQCLNTKTTCSVQSHSYPVSTTCSSYHCHPNPSSNIKTNCCGPGYQLCRNPQTAHHFPQQPSQKSQPIYPAVTSVPYNIPKQTTVNTSASICQVPSLNAPVHKSETLPSSLPSERIPVYDFPGYPGSAYPYRRENSSPVTTPSISSSVSSFVTSSTEKSSTFLSSSNATAFLSATTTSTTSLHTVVRSASPVTCVTAVSSQHTIKPLWSTVATTAANSSYQHVRDVTPVPARESHSSSNSSISSLSQLSQTFPANSGTSVKDTPREGAASSSSSGRSRSSSRNTTPSVSSASIVRTSSPAAFSASCTASYGTPGSLTSLVFSKPSSWTSPSANTLLSSSGGSHSASPVAQHQDLSQGALPLAPTLHNSSHHNSPFGPHPAPTAAVLHSGGPHVMFAPPLPPTGSLSSSSLPLGAGSGPSSFGDQDLLRRELDTRFLASQDRSINIPPPPYMRTEMHQHQHQHTHMHQHSPFLPPPLGGSLVPPSAAHLYDKFPKIDSSFYSRNALGLPGYPGLSPLLAPGAAAAAATPFAPPGHLAAFQPKMTSVVKTKNVKSGRWCAMHVRIAWEIYHHQQKQQAETQKPSGTSASAISTATKSASDLLRPPNHLFASLPRPPDLAFSSSLLGAAASVHSRAPYDVSPQHNTFLGPSPAHLGVSPFARPGYPGFGTPGSSFGGLGSLAGLTGSMFSSRDLGPSCLGMGQDPWSRLHRTPPNFPAPSATSAASWGGLKAEAERERERLHREEQEREKNKKVEMEKEKREKESEKPKEIHRDKRDQDKQKERDRDVRASHHSNSIDVLRNGEVVERGRERERDWERSRERRDSSRSPIRINREICSKTDSAFESSNPGPKQEVKVKEEKKDDDHPTGSRDSATSAGPERERTRSTENPRTDVTGDFLPRSLPPALGMGLNSLDRSRMMGPLGLGPHTDRPPHSQVPHFWGPLPPPHPSSTTTSSSLTTAEHYRNLELQQMRELDREQLMQKYASLSSVMPLPPDRYRDIELARHLAVSSEAAARDIERQLQMDRDRQAYDRGKLPPPPLRPNDPPYVPPPGLPSTAVSGALFSSLSNPFLNSLCGAGIPPRNKTNSPGNVGNGIPPPLIPCTGPTSSPSGTGSVQNHSTPHAHNTPSPLHHKLGGAPVAGVENSHEPFFTKERREAHSHPTEVESQSR